MAASTLAGCATADIQPTRVEVAPDYFRPDLDRPDTSHVAEHRDTVTKTFERPGGYYYAFWYETPGPSLAEDVAVQPRVAVPRVVPVPVPKRSDLTQLADAPTIYPWAYSPEASADPHRDTWVRHCDSKPLTDDEYDFVGSRPIPDYANPCYPPK